ncbi:MAG: hypothetical protein KBS53_02125 [Bacteroidales bacterium]|nr:hypothetical protein [Candidatus Hennigimonas equi]
MFQCTVNPSETKCHFNGINIIYDSITLLDTAIDPDPEFANLIMIQLEPLVQFRPGTYFKDIVDYHYSE